MRRRLIVGISLLIGCVRVADLGGERRMEIVAWAALPADTFAAGPGSGAHLDGEHGAPWASQPVQGFSALIAEPDGGFLAVTDNGYGAAENSSDFLLRVYELSADFEAGRLTARERFTLHDPDRRIAFPIVNHFTTGRLLTGADLDIESMVRARDGTFWFGDELGPFLVHTDDTGRLLDAPFELEVRSPDNPFLPENLTLRSLEALRADALAHDAGAPWFSPDEGLLTAELLTRFHRAGFRVIPWTVNAEQRMKDLLELGVDGLITDRPDLAARLVDWPVHRKLTATGDRLLAALGLDRQVAAFLARLPPSTSGDGGEARASAPRPFVYELARVDRAPPRWSACTPTSTARRRLQHTDGGAELCPDAIDLEGHRGARGLRPENTLPAFEAGLDHGVTTLELDVTGTDDGAILWHDATLDAKKCRSPDGGASLQLTRAPSALASRQWICDRLQSEFPAQKNDRELSPVARSFPPMRLAADLYSPVELERLLSFLAWYQGYYSSGVGAPQSTSAARAATARAVRLNIETKVHATGAPHDDPAWLARYLGDLLLRSGFLPRASLQSFDWRSLRVAHAEFPLLQTVALLGAKNVSAPDDVRAGLPWPQVEGRPSSRVVRSGGFESLAISPDGATLYAMLEKPLPGERELLAYSFDLTSRRFTGVAWRYPLDAAAVGDMTLGPGGVGWALERDDGEGPRARHKKLVQFALPAVPGGLVVKQAAADLLRLRARPPLPSDFPFVTPEGVAVLPGGRIAIIADNNFPFGRARHPETATPDDTELIILALP